MVVSGAVRTYKVLADGRRQICAFHLRGDFFGLEPDNKHAFSAETIVNSKIRPIKRAAWTAQAEDDKEAARQLWAMTGDELKRVRTHVPAIDQDRERARSGISAGNGRARLYG
jgi:CRP/FNR family nitrogen fixation transcriptional regulator